MFLIDVGQKPGLMRKLNDRYNATCEHALLSIGQRTNMTDAGTLSKKSRDDQVRKSRSFATEIFYLSQRTLRNNRRNPSLSVSQIGISIVLGLLVDCSFMIYTKQQDLVFKIDLVQRFSLFSVRFSLT